MSGTARGGFVLASSNPGKLAEFRELLDGTPIRVELLHPGSATVPEETGESFVENALIKARHASILAGRPAIADDSGLCVDALGGAPGVRSARFAGDGLPDEAHVERLLRELKDVPPAGRGASFYCVIVAIGRADDPAPLIATGCWRGLIVTEPKGRNGFGYDPVFFDPALGRTAAELSPQEKNAVSHRARACGELKRLLGL